MGASRLEKTWVTSAFGHRPAQSKGVNVRQWPKAEVKSMSVLFAPKVGRA
jgi:hypothetical protein